MNKRRQCEWYKSYYLTVLVLTCAACETLSGVVHHETGTWSAGNFAHEVGVAESARSFILHTPKVVRHSRLGRARPYPLVVVLHGSGADGGDIQRVAQFDSIADREGFLVVYPDASRLALGRSTSDWNAGTCCGPAAQRDVDDVGFILKVIDLVSSRVAVDSRRVYVAGFSDGGRMAYKLACAASGRIAAIAVVAGSVRQPHCALASPVALMAFHGTADKSVPYNEPSDTPMPNAPAAANLALPPSVNLWAWLNGCRSLRSRVVATHVIRYDFAKCKGEEVVFYSIAEGGHSWPGEEIGSGGSGPESELAATPAIVNFLMHHTRHSKGI